MHDVGGLDFGAIDRHEHDLAQWEKRVDAMMILLYAKKGAFKVDGMRRVIEDYGQQAYDSTTYYEKVGAGAAQPDGRAGHPHR